MRPFPSEHSLCSSTNAWCCVPHAVAQCCRCCERRPSLSCCRPRRRGRRSMPEPTAGASLPGWRISNGRDAMSRRGPPSTPLSQRLSSYGSGLWRSRPVWTPRLQRSPRARGRQLRHCAGPKSDLPAALRTRTLGAPMPARARPRRPCSTIHHPLDLLSNLPGIDDLERDAVERLHMPLANQMGGVQMVQFWHGP